MKVMYPVVVFALFVCATASAAVPVNDQLVEARQKWAGAVRMAVALQIRQASEEFDEALELFARGMPAVADYEEYARCLIDYGAVSADAGKKDFAEKLFLRALVLGTDAKTNPRHHSPRAVAAFTKAKKSLGRVGRTSLSIVGRPEGAQVTVDGREHGAVPISLPDLYVGDHFVSVTSAGHSRFFAKVTLLAGRPEKLDVFLRDLREPASAPASIDVAAPPPASVPVAAASAPVTIALPPPPPAERVHPALAMLPFGAGQFIAQRPGAGAAFLVTETALLATNIAAFIAMTRLRGADNQYAAKDAGAATALMWTTNIAFGLLIAEVIGGAIDGVVNR